VSTLAYADPFSAAVEGATNTPDAFEPTSNMTQLNHALPVPSNATAGSLAAS
jgi:hypothetical protein